MLSVSSYQSVADNDQFLSTFRKQHIVSKIDPLFHFQPYFSVFNLFFYQFLVTVFHFSDSVFQFLVSQILSVLCQFSLLEIASVNCKNSC